MQELGIVARLYPLVLSGEKKSSIRWREGDIQPGLLTYRCGENPALTAVVLVTRVTAMPLSEAAAFVGREREWPKDVMLSGMREHYPAIEWDDEVVVVEHLSPAETAEIIARTR